ncbi:LacI family DNA-binding transcriptional regulator [Demequina soli]|uniref:LacI family DNA-binding transcriptional regulator n=1 Tax=Demequina soli TaxID=1638987 RepID=UPI000784CD2E|nr:LacI family DNA-binding transcriptional regulator [Demequina soli]
MTERSTAQRRAAKGATMADVARLAGVALKTVSRVVNDEPNVRDEVRARVHAAIAEAGYRPNAAARALVTSRTRTLGVVTMSTTFRGPSAILAGVEAAARDAGYGIALTRTPTGSPEAIAAAMDALVDRGVDGIVILEPAQSTATIGHETPGTPVVVFEDRPGDSADWIRVGADDVGACREAVAHLLALGHGTVHHVAGPAGWRTSDARAEGWRTALEAAGRAVPAPVTGDWSAASGFEAGMALAARPDLTAVLCANDDMAIGLIHALEGRGLTVPGDVSVVGMDGSEVSAYLHTPLTTLAQDFEAIAREGVARLLDAVEGREPESRRVSVPVRLVVRASTDAPRIVAGEPA